MEAGAAARGGAPAGSANALTTHEIPEDANVYDLEPSQHRNGGFTLVELLVVIGIIGVLTGLLLPSLSKAKDQAIRLTDVNNLRQQTLALHLYVTDSSDVLPWPNWLAGDGPNRPGWLYTLDISVAGSARFKVETGVFWKTLKNPKLYMCPADLPTLPLFALRGQKISSYVMNGAVIGYARMVVPVEKMGDMAPDAVAFWETDEEKPKTYFNDGASYPKEGVSARHNRGAINGTFGGSVSYIKFGEWYREVENPVRNRLWCYPGSTNGR